MSNKDQLTEKQENAIELMLQGMKDGEVAERLGVSRQWVNQWRNHDDLFIDALRERCRGLQEAHSRQLEGLVEEAIGVVREALRSENHQLRLKAAMYILKMVGLRGYMKPDAEATAQERTRQALLEALREVTEEMGIGEG